MSVRRGAEDWELVRSRWYEESSVQGSTVDRAVEEETGRRGRLLTEKKIPEKDCEDRGWRRKQRLGMVCCKAAMFLRLV